MGAPALVIPTILAAAMPSDSRAPGRPAPLGVLPLDVMVVLGPVIANEGTAPPVGSLRSAARRGAASGPMAKHPPDSARGASSPQRSSPLMAAGRTVWREESESRSSRREC